MDEKSIRPFIDALEDLAKTKQASFMTKDVEGAILILTVRDGGRLRTAIATVNTDISDYHAAMVTIVQVIEQDLMGQAVEVPCGAIVN